MATIIIVVLVSFACIGLLAQWYTRILEETEEDTLFED